MASFMDDYNEGQEGGVDATETGAPTSAIDSSVSLIGTRDKSAIAQARLRAKGIKDEHILQQVHGIESGTPTVVPLSEQLGSMFTRFGQSIAKGTGDLASGAGLIRKHLDDPTIAVAHGADQAYMSDVERMEQSRRMQGKTDQERESIRIADWTRRRDEFVKGTEDFASAMPEIGKKKTSGVLGVMDDAMTGMAQFAPTMGLAAATGGALAIPSAYMQILPGKFEEYKADGVPEDRAFEYANAAAQGLAVIEGLGTNIQLSKLAGAFGKKGLGKGLMKKFVDQVVSNGLTEGFEELSQGEVEVIFDVMAKNPDASPEQMGEKVVQIWKDPDFQKGKLYEAGIGVVGGSMMGAGGAVAGEISQRIGAKAEKVDDGEFIVKPDDAKDLPDITTDTTQHGNPTVNQLMGAEEDSREKTSSDGEDGVVLSDGLTATPDQTEKSKKTSAALTDTLENMKLDKGMKRDKIDIENNSRKLETISDLYSQAIVDEDFDEALTLAEHFAATVDDSAAKLDNVVNSKSRRLAKDDIAMLPEEVNSVQQYKQEKFKQAHNMVSTAVKKVKAAEYTEAANMQEALESDPKILKEALTKVERRNKANSPDTAKEARKVKDIIDSREYMSDDTFLAKMAKPEKLLSLKSDLENRLIDQKEDPNVGSSEQAITQASLKLVDQTLQEKRVFDEAQAEKTRIDEQRRLLQQQATRMTSSDKPRVEARKKELAGKVATTELEKRRETARAKSAKIVAKQAEKKAVIQKQEAQLRPAPARPVSEKRRDELEASKARKAAVEKQKAEVAKTEGKTHTLPKKVAVKDLQSEKAEYVILTPDNPQSKTAPEFQNRRARIKLQKELDSLGIDYETADSYFEEDVEKAFIIKGMTKEQGKELSDRLNQTSYIHGKGENLDLIEGDTVRRVKKRDAKVAQNPMAYTMIQGKKWAAPFYTEKESIIDFEQAEISDEEVMAAKSAFRAAAIQYKGKTFEGTSHMDIIQKNDALQNALIDMPVSQIHAQFDHGFVTHDGNFTDRMTATKQLGLKKGDYLTSEAFLAPVLKVKAEQMQKESGVNIPALEEMKLADQMGILELADSLRAEMTDGKYSWLFDKTIESGVETVMVTSPGQYGKEETVKRFYPDLKSKDDAVTRFEGGLKVDPKTGRMIQTHGVKGVYIKADPMKGNYGGKAFINLPTISQRAKSIAQALETVVHEHIHGAVDHAVRKLDKIKKAALMKDLQDVWNSIPKSFVDQTLEAKDTHIRVGAGIIQIRRDGVGELITYAMAHPEFAAWLNTIPASPKFKAQSKGIKTVWDKLVNMIAKLVSPSKLTEVTEIMNKHLNIGLQEVKFSREAEFDFGANVTPENVKSWTDELDNAAVNALETTVVKNAEEAEEILGYNPGDTAVSFWVPESQTQKPYGAKKGWKPTTTPGRVVLIADRIESQEHAISKWMHEQVGHQGLHNIFPTKHSYDSFMESAYRMFAIQDSKVLEEIQDLYDIGKLQISGKRKLTFKDKVAAAEEVIGNRAGTLAPVTKKGLVAKLKKFLSRWLPKVFVGKKNTFKLKDADIWNIIEMARENVFTGDTQFGELIQKAMDARAPKVKYKGWETLPPFMKTDEEYKQWMREVRKADPKQVKWYTQHKNTLLKIFGKDADLFNVLLSVTSPNADVETNVLFAAQTYAYLMGAVDKPGALYVNKLQDRIDNHWTSPEAMYRNLESNLFKVTEFVRALMGDPDATVGDMWMYRAFFGDPKSNNQKVEKFSVPQTVAMRQKLHDLASQMSDETGETWTPREVQAAIWVHINAKANNKDFGQIATYESGLNKPVNKFDGKTPLEWLTGMFPNMKDGILGEHIGVKAIPMAPISPLEKKLLGQIDTELKAKKSKPGYKVDKGVITITPTENKRLETVRIMRAIVAGGREVTVNDDVTAEWMKKTFGFEETQKSSDNTVTMRLRDDAVGLFTSKTGKVTFGALRDNLGGFSGTYTQEVRFSREAVDNLESMHDMSSEDANADFLRTGNDGVSVIGKVHELRDKASQNWNRFINALEQDFLDKFGGRDVSRILRVFGFASGNKLNTSSTELLQKAMNLYIDSGTGANLEKVMAYGQKIANNTKATNREKEQLQIIERMVAMTNDERVWADSNIRPYYEDLFEFAQKNNLIDSHVDNYVKRSWKMPKHLKDAQVSWSGSGTTGFKLTPDSGKQRSLDSIIDGWEAGMDLRSSGILQNLSDYSQQLSYVSANRRFVEYMRGLIGWDAESLMFEQNVKTSPDFRPPEGFTQVTVHGMAKPFHKLFARQDIARELNKLGRTASEIWNLPGIKGMTRVNSSVKSTILSVNMFHHLAGMRSYLFGVSGKGWKINPVTAYKRGLKKIDERPGFDSPTYNHLGPIVDMLVAEGLTLGAKQDWDESAIQESWIADTLMKGDSKASFIALKAWNAARRKKRSLTGGLFNRLFAGLKAESASMELVHSIRKQEKKLGRALTDAEIKLTAQQIARLINSDFGGLHLGRMGRHPDLQKALQGLLLAPDWTESNWRTVTGMIPGLNKLTDKLFGGTPGPPGMQKVYRKFWGGIVLRAGFTSLMANLGMQMLLAGVGDDEAWDDWKNFQTEQWGSWSQWTKGRWLDLDVTGLYKLVGADDPGKRNVISIAGHFKDLIKIFHPVTLAKHKLAPLPNRMLDAITGSDWKGAPFRPLNEMIEDGKLKIVDEKQFGGRIDPVDWSTAGSFMLYSLMQTQPIPLSNMMQAYTGESALLSSTLRSVGLDTRDIRRVPVAQKKFEDISSDINELERNLKDAKTVRDQKLITEARRDIKDYPNYNRIKSRIGFTKSRIANENRKLKAINLKVRNGTSLTAQEEQKLKDINERKQAIYEKAVQVLDR